MLESHKIEDMLNIWRQKREEKQMNQSKDYTPFLQDNFIIFNKNGIIWYNRDEENTRLW